jgi:hypothetical protein
MTSWPEEADGALGGHGRRPERTGHHPVEGLSEIGPAGRLLRPGLDDGHPGQFERGDRFPQEPAGTLTGFEEDQIELGPGRGDDEAGQASAAPEVEYPTMPGEPVQQGAAVLDVPGDRTGPEKAEVLRPEEDGFEGGGRRYRVVTRRRRGP